MDIHLEFVPGDSCWVMCQNRPIELIVDTVSIYVGLDHSQIKVGIEYGLGSGSFGGKYRREDMCHTKEELKQKIFG